MQSAGDTELIGYFCLGQVELLTALTNTAAEIAFETVGHDGLLLGRAERQLRPETIIEEAAGPTKERCIAIIAYRRLTDLDQLRPPCASGLVC